MRGGAGNADLECSDTADTVDAELSDAELLCAVSAVMSSVRPAGKPLLRLSVREAKWRAILASGSVPSMCRTSEENEERIVTEAVRQWNNNVSRSVSRNALLERAA
jgi:hypothetical protein